MAPRSSPWQHHPPFQLQSTIGWWLVMFWWSRNVAYTVNWISRQISYSPKSMFRATLMIYVGGNLIVDAWVVILSVFFYFLFYHYWFRLIKIIRFSYATWNLNFRHIFKDKRQCTKSCAYYTLLFKPSAYSIRNSVLPSKWIWSRRGVGAKFHCRAVRPEARSWNYI